MDSFTLPSLPQKRYLTTDEAVKFCGIPRNTLYRWESKFPMLKPSRRSGRRYYRQEDIAMVLKIKHLLHEQKLSEIDAMLTLKHSDTPLAELRAHYLPYTIKKPKNLYVEARGEYVSTGAHDLNMDHGFSARSIAQICRVSERAARRYLKAKKAPYAACRLLDLHGRGRILPDSWNHCFINTRGNLEIYQVGEVTENDITSMQWMNGLSTGRINRLTKELDETQIRVKELEELLAQEQAKHAVKTDSNPITTLETIRCNMKNPNLYSVKRQLEIVIEAFQGLEQTASRSDGDATSVGNAMVPIIFLAEDVLKDLETIYEQSKSGTQGATTQSAPLVLLTFPKSETEQ